MDGSSRTYVRHFSKRHQKYMCRKNFDKSNSAVNKCAFDFDSFRVDRRTSLSSSNPRNALSNPCADWTTRTPQAKDSTEARAKPSCARSISPDPHRRGRLLSHSYCRILRSHVRAAHARRTESIFRCCVRFAPASSQNLCQYFLRRDRMGSLAGICSLCP